MSLLLGNMSFSSRDYGMVSILVNQILCWSPNGGGVRPTEQKLLSKKTG